MLATWQLRALAFGTLIMLGLFVIAQSFTSAQQAEKRESWEYHKESSDIAVGFSDSVARKLGEEGWELVTVYESEKKLKAYAIYKRKR